ncbi:MAG: hypothetical protein SH847_23475 [Roseiflexaceae bacterium]|nr:hypothetical protein [Roseiflexaceae bacterium]
MPQPYQLAQTFAPTSDFDQQLATLNLDATHLCTCSGVPPSTYIRMRRLRSASRRTAQRIAYGFALAHGAMKPKIAFGMLFTANPRVVMESNSCGRHHRRNDP